MTLKAIMLSEINQAQKGNHCTAPLIECDSRCLRESHSESESRKVVIRGWRRGTTELPFNWSEFLFYQMKHYRDGWW